MNIHFGQRRHERLFGALVALEQLGREAPIPVLRHPEFELADASDEGAGVIASAVAETGGRALALLGPERIRHLGFEHLLHDGTHDGAQAIRVCGEQVFDGGERGFTLGLGHGGISLRSR